MIFTYKNDTNERLDKFLSKKLKEYSRSEIQKFIKNGLIKINNEIITSKKYLLNKNDKIEVKIPQENNFETQIKNSIKILAETDDYFIIYKPANLLSHPVKNLNEDSVISQVLKIYPKLQNIGENPLRPAMVHRLDKMVSGIMLITKNQEAFDYYKKLFKERKIEKWYYALVYGKIEKESDYLNYILDRKNNTVKIIAKPSNQENEKSREAQTYFETLKHYKNYTLVNIKLITGRKHQIRAHFYAYGHPILGDHLYNNKKFKKVNLNQIFLHSHSLKFIDRTGQEQKYYCPLNPYLKKYLNKLTMTRQLFIISGASGVGKSAIIIELLKNYKKELNLETGTTYTTRPSRTISEDKQIITVSREEFEDMIKNNEFVEWAEVHNHYYGTNKNVLEKTLKEHNLILNIDIQGALQIKKLYPEAWLIFIDAPLKDLEERLRNRGTNSEEDIQTRLNNAKKEKEFAQYYDIVIENKNGKMQEAVKELKNYIEDKIQK